MREYEFFPDSARGRRGIIRWAIAFFVPTFGAIGLLTLRSGEGPTGTWAVGALVAIVLTTVPIAVMIGRAPLGRMWVAPRSRSHRVNLAFVLYSDVGVTAVLLTFTRAEAALYGSALFAIISVFVAHFCDRIIRGIHIAGTTIVILALAAWTMKQGGHDFAGVAARTLVSLATVNGTVLLQSMWAIDVKRDLYQSLLRAHQDPLTKLWNRRGFIHWTTALLDEQPADLGILLLDIDNFKTINDTYGHDAGDQVLHTVADRFQSVVSVDMIVSRTGGDEFAIATTLQSHDLLSLAEQLCCAVERGSDRHPITVTCGAATATLTRQTFDVTHATLAAALQAADAALYRAKKAGRNQVALQVVTPPS